MSRIHEALKKAAEERSTQTANPAVSDLVDLSSRPPAADLVQTNVGASARGKSPQKLQPEVLQYEEFKRR
ncbi:MAG TPA: hypothetical protein VNO32_21660, partial [Candidatus Acidoferrum sp.]|nr:hypothetical protein [Candidatus Acidoferrum sp.]